MSYLVKINSNTTNTSRQLLTPPISKLFGEFYDRYKFIFNNLMNCTQALFYCFSSSRMFCSDLLGAVCLLNFARRTAQESSASHPCKCKMHKFYKMYKAIFFCFEQIYIFSVWGCKVFVNGIHL